MDANNNAHPLLSATARWTAAVRALESDREDRLFHDPWAAALAGPEGMEWVAGRPPERLVTIVLRTRFFDDFLQRITRQEGLRQVVMLAAGLDTRACRLTWPAGTRLFELDQAQVLDHKQVVLSAAGAQPNCERIALEADLTGEWLPGLVAAGFDPSLPAGWLLEGFLFYLPDDSLERILDEVCRVAAPGSRLGFDVINHEVLKSPYTRAWVEMQAQLGAPWTGALDDPEAFLAARGWQAELSQAGAKEASFGRWSLPVLPVRMPGVPHNWFVTANKG